MGWADVNASRGLAHLISRQRWAVHNNVIPTAQTGGSKEARRPQGLTVTSVFCFRHWQGHLHLIFGPWSALSSCGIGPKAFTDHSLLPGLTSPSPPLQCRGRQRTGPRLEDLAPLSTHHSFFSFLPRPRLLRPA